MLKKIKVLSLRKKRLIQIYSLLCFSTLATSSELHRGVMLGGGNHNNHKKESTLTCKLINRPLLIKYWIWSHVQVRFLPSEMEIFPNESEVAIDVSLPPSLPCLHRSRELLLCSFHSSATQSLRAFPMPPEVLLRTHSLDELCHRSVLLPRHSLITLRTNVKFKNE